MPRLVPTMWEVLDQHGRVVGLVGREVDPPERSMRYWADPLTTGRDNRVWCETRAEAVRALECILAVSQPVLV